MKDDHVLLRQWLGLQPEGPWPPPAWELLGLPPGHNDSAAVVPYEELEARVLERMERLRPYQLRYPELVTEGMNRLAQALLQVLPASTSTSFTIRPEDSNTTQENRRSEASKVDRTVAEGAGIEPAVPRDLSVATGESFHGALSSETGLQSHDPSNTPNRVTNTAERGNPLRATSEQERQPHASTGSATFFVGKGHSGTIPRMPETPLILPGAARLESRQQNLIGTDSRSDGLADSQRALIRRLVRLRRLWRCWYELGSLWRTSAWLEHPLDLLRFHQLHQQLRTALEQIEPPWTLGPSHEGAMADALLRREDAAVVLRWLQPDQRLRFLIDWRWGEQRLAEAYAQLKGQLNMLRRRRHRWRRWQRVGRLLVAQPETWLVFLLAIMSVIAWLRA